jgi:2-oxoglutarate ferredoxin oxidoreductase subunit gamma
MRTEFRLSGFGGQGIVLGGYILGKAASIHSQGMDAAMTQSYGPEARGGACTSNVVVEDGPLAYPAVTEPDILILMSQEAYTTHQKHIRAGVKVLYDEDLVMVHEDIAGERIPVPALRIAQDELGRRIVANIVMLGFLAATSEVLSVQSMKEAVLSSVPAHTKELNEKAFDRGYEEGLKAKGQAS